MKIGIVSHEGTPNLAAFYRDGWIALREVLPKVGRIGVNELSAFIKRYGSDVVALNGEILNFLSTGEGSTYLHPVTDRLAYLPPVPAVPLLLTARGNSACFTRVIKMKLPKQPTLEQRFNFNMVGHNSTWRVPEDLAGSGWNYEMVAVMGSSCRNTDEAHALDHVFGYTNMLDHGCRRKNYPFDKGNRWAIPDEEKQFTDWDYEGSCNGNTQGPLPIGPYITTKDEVGDPHALMIEERESGRLLALGSSAAVLFTFPEIISYLSSFTTLRPGDMLSSASITYDGYPYWGEVFPPGAYWQAKIEKLGTLRLNIEDHRKEAMQ